MSTTIAVTNTGLRKFAVKGFGVLAATPTVTKTKVVKQVNADDISKNFDLAARFGVVITENGTARPGSVVVTATGPLVAADRTAIVDMTANITLTLPALAGVAVGHTIVVFLRTASAGTLTVDGNGAETVLGAANQTYTTAGSVLRIQKESATNWKAMVI